MKSLMEALMEFSRYKKGATDVEKFMFVGACVKEIVEHDVDLVKRMVTDYMEKNGHRSYIMQVTVSAMRKGSPVPVIELFAEVPEDAKKRFDMMKGAGAKIWKEGMTAVSAVLSSETFMGHAENEEELDGKPKRIEHWKERDEAMLVCGIGCDGSKEAWTRKMERKDGVLVWLSDWEKMHQDFQLELFREFWIGYASAAAETGMMR